MIQLAYHYCPKCGAALQVVAHDGVEHQQCTQCGYVLYMNQNVCVSALFVQDGRMLLVRRAIEPAKGKLDFVGGFVEPNESVEDAIKREVKEELGVETKISRFIGVYGPDPYPVGDVVVYNSAVTYLCTITSGTPTPHDDVASIEWWSLHELPAPSEMAFPSQSQVITLLRDGKLSLE